MLKFFAGFAAISGFLAVALGAFGSHGLRGKLPENLYNAFVVGVQYQFYHTLALLFVVYLLGQHSHRLLIFTATAYCLGVLLFSGSLYGLAMNGPKWLGPVTPLGGLCFMVGWLLLAAYAIFYWQK
jgi:uncharacterized membrane protein YgdD (TMEM256/DUF423 family)